MFAFHCGGEKTLRSVFDPFDQDCGSTIHVPYFFYLIQHPDGNVLFDSGAHPALLDDPRSRLGAAADLYEIVMSPGDDVRSRLGSLGVDAEDIGHVVQSHLHYDHAGGLEFVQGATVYVQREELAFAYWPPVYQRDVYVRQDFDAVANWKQLHGEHDIFNDGRLIIFPTPGHTPGHQSMLVRLDSEAYILAGDAVYDRDKMAGPLPARAAVEPGRDHRELGEDRGDAAAEQCQAHRHPRPALARQRQARAGGVVRVTSPIPDGRPDGMPGTAAPERDIIELVRDACRRTRTSRR